MVDKKLQGIRLDPRKPKTAIMAYADDVTIMLTSQEETKIVQDSIKGYQNASGAKINLDKSKALAI
jgi:hypothetical protein